MQARLFKTYKTVKIGEQVWMAENLNYEVGGKCYGEGGKVYNQETKKYGRLYNWETAMRACTKNWHLPSKEEWEILVVAVGGEKTASKYLKATSGWERKYCNGEDKFGFSALPRWHKLRQR